MTLIKWPGGKSREIKYFEDSIPSFERYIEPFFGGGALFFHLMPSKSIINDISSNLISFYKMIQSQNEKFQDLLISYDNTFKSLIKHAEESESLLFEKYTNNDKFSIHEIRSIFESIVVSDVILNDNEFLEYIHSSINDKINRTIANNTKKPLIYDDIINNLITGVTSGFYLYSRNLYNQIQLDKLKCSEEFKTANFYWIREYCYGSMFRYNSSGEFNIPYGGISYNKKNFKRKIDEIFSKNIQDLFNETLIYNLDFENFLNELDLTNNDFIFLDPPYDTTFNSYEDNEFNLNDQIRLRDFMLHTKSKAMLVIKNTEFIYNLYSVSTKFKILNFQKNYTYNVRSRNDRSVNHLIIINY